MKYYGALLGRCIDLLFPRCCLTCTTVLTHPESLICLACWQDLDQTNYHLDSHNSLIQRLYDRLPIQYAVALYKFRKKSKVQKLLHYIKYKNQPQLANLLGQKYGTMLRSLDWHSTIDLIISVPLHPHKLRKRGYNQSDHFAQGLSEVLNIPWNNQCLVRTKNTLSQTANQRVERLNNLDEAFLVVDAECIYDRNVLLVDDVITTGATVLACGSALLRADIKSLSIATLAVVE